MPPRPPSETRRCGFSLVELLASLAVLVLLMAMVAQIVGSAANSIQTSRGRMDSNAQSRVVFGQMASDFQNLVRQRGLDYSSFKHTGYTVSEEFGGRQHPPNPQSGNDEMAFYAETEGSYPGGSAPSTTARSPVALVAYRIAPAQDHGGMSIQRQGVGLGWEPAPDGRWKNVHYLPSTITGEWPGLFANGDSFLPLGEHVFRIEYCYLLKATADRPARFSVTPWDASQTGHTDIDGFRDVAAIVVTLAILDGDNHERVDDYAPLIQAFPDAADGETPRETWTEIILAPDFAQTAQVSPSVASSVRVYERYFYLDGS